MALNEDATNEQTKSLLADHDESVSSLAGGLRTGKEKEGSSSNKKRRPGDEENAGVASRSSLSLMYLRYLCLGGDWDKLQPPQSTLEVKDYNKEMKRADSHFRLVALVTAIASTVMAIIMTTLYGTAAEGTAITPKERSIAFVGFIVMLATMISKFLPLFFRGGEYQAISGVVILSATVHVISMSCNGLMAFGIAPIVVDPVTGCRVHLMRWCEWIPTAFAMTFVVDASDIPDPSYGFAAAYITGVGQGISTLGGILLPFCPNFSVWMAVMTNSIMWFLALFVRLYYKERRAQLLPTGGRLDQVEIRIRAKLALKLLRACAVGWTSLVVIYMALSVVAPLLAPEGSFFADKSLSMAGETFCDVVLKFCYMAYVMDMHTQVFDEGVRSKRRLEELRQMMWDNSSDVLAISVESLSGNVMTMISPTFFRLLQNVESLSALGSDARNNQVLMDQGRRGMVLELHKKDMAQILEFGLRSRDETIKPRLYNFDFGGLTPKNMQEKVKNSRDLADEIGAAELEALVKLMGKSWGCTTVHSLFPHTLCLKSSENELKEVQCEAKVTRLEEAALFVVVRDISERFRRFEAEKMAVSQMVARNKDSEANRFTRHEVKNGLLAGMGLCDSLRDLSAPDNLDNIVEALCSNGDTSRISLVHDNISRLVAELDSTLHEVLETVLAEAMAKDVIHEAYVPLLERLNVPDLIRQMLVRGESKGTRFPVVTEPTHFPVFVFDRQLLKCIHRNAISNACKYGKTGAKVETRLSYDHVSKMFQMDVVNEPGVNYDEVLKLGEKAKEEVFSQGCRLAAHTKGHKKKGVALQHSSGDGAWIIQKCAKTLGGTVTIDFLENETVFSLRCPAEIVKESSDIENSTTFSFPSDTWAIAIDDSKMQRKLLDRFLTMIGIEKSQIIVRGETNEEITSFDDFVVDFVESHPRCHLLLIVDENLDLPFEGFQHKDSTVSGSILVQHIRQRLLPEEEAQVLALVRSANDSSHDIAIYNSRAHGFIAKAPVKKETAVELIRPHWEKRFGSQQKPRSVKEDDECTTDSSVAGVSPWAARVRASRSSVSCDEISGIFDDQSYFDDCIKEHVVAIEAIILTKSDLIESWGALWERLHALKGDVLCSGDSEETREIASEIEHLRGRSLPVDFSAKWETLRSHVLSL